MAKSKLPKLPKEIHAAWNDEIDEPYVQAGVEAADLVDGAEWREVGVYRLVKTIKVRESHEIQTK